MKNPDQKLFETASTQLGFFTAKQAITAGFSSKNHTYHIKQGHWIREYRSIYRLSNFPYTPEGEYVLWSLWSRGRTDIPQGVYSYETALSIYEISDTMPPKLNMTVPTTFRKLVDTPKVLKLHYATLTPTDIQQKSGYSVTTPFKTIQDLASDPATDSYILNQAINEFRNRGMITEKQIGVLAQQFPIFTKFILQGGPAMRI